MAIVSIHPALLLMLLNRPPMILPFTLHFNMQQMSYTLTPTYNTCPLRRYRIWWRCKISLHILYPLNPLLLGYKIRLPRFVSQKIQEDILRIHYMAQVTLINCSEIFSGKTQCKIRHKFIYRYSFFSHIPGNNTRLVLLWLAMRGWLK